MSESTNISYATHTASPWFGCSKVSAGCTNCYAEQLTVQHKWAGWGDNSPRVRSKGFWKDAYKYNRAAADELQRWTERRSEAVRGGMALHDPGKLFLERLDAAKPERPHMFTSLMDWLDPQAPIEWLADFLKVIHDCQNLDWLLLTKRPELWEERVQAAMNAAKGDLVMWLYDWCMYQKEGGKYPGKPNPPSNVWFGVTVENQEMADLRIPILQSIPARIRWLSVEPLLEPIKFRTPADLLGISWIVCGGESGPKRRDCGLYAICDVVEQCLQANVPVFVKQDVGLKPGLQGRIPDTVWARKEYPKC